MKEWRPGFIEWLHIELREKDFYLFDEVADSRELTHFSNVVFGLEENDTFEILILEG